MLQRPQLYLNGTAPLNTTGVIHSCVFQLNENTADPGVCTDVTGTDRDSFLWYVYASIRCSIYAKNFHASGSMSYILLSKQIALLPVK